ncbi:signal transduction histidine kinase [Arthrobacter sp. CAN_A6]|uniref:ATP-binding protein n=1 Tax=Arthrobacter sp. CAN_A6 TaxID=2787721 RepID=UPI0018CB6151
MRPPLLRSPDGVIAGVCAGLAVHLGFSIRFVRIAMVLLTFASGAGALLYAWLWIFVPSSTDSAAAVKVRNGPARFMNDHPARRAGRKEFLFGAVMLLLAAAFAAQQLGLPVEWGTLLPLGVVAAGAALAWAQLDDVRRAGLMDRAGAHRASGLARLLVGLVLVIVGVLVMVSGSIPWSLTWATLVATAAVLGGVGLVLAPWGLKFWRDLEVERAGRVREAARAEFAAHLHDSVLQTLALIQNRATSESDVIRLARAQERELRQWLYSDHADQAGTLAERIRAFAAEVEDAYGYSVTVVAVGDAPLTPGNEALAQAAREAMLNAAKHARVPVSVYLELGAHGSDVFIRDRGTGFDETAVPPDRLGIRESIHGRLSRHGGHALIRSGPDGTEVTLSMPEHTAKDRWESNGQGS